MSNEARNVDYVFADVRRASLEDQNIDVRILG